MTKSDIIKEIVQKTGLDKEVVSHCLLYTSDAADD